MEIETYIQLAGPLFEAVQREEVFPDPKTFVDATPKNDPKAILSLYLKKKNQPDFDLKTFVLDHFTFEEEIALPQNSPLKMEDYLSETWDLLFKEMDPPSPYSTLISLPYPHPVPGGRFRECFYWDSYFIALGLAVENRVERIKHMVKNFSSLIDRFGFIPNGNRVYFLSRSQPPYFSFLLTLLSELGEEEEALAHTKALEKEYLFWMDGANRLSFRDLARKSVVSTERDQVLNRYWDRFDFPRPEAYKRELTLGKGVLKKNFYRSLRAICASGWDFSSRWLGKEEGFEGNLILDLLPLDLNCLLYHMEITLAEFTAKQGIRSASAYKRAASKRKKLIQTLFWDPNHQFFFDYNWTQKKLSSSWSLAAATPLFLKIATPHQANSVALHLKKEFLLPGGFVTTLHKTGHQWDFPNGWAPLQWITIQGLLNYGHTSLAEEGARRWLDLNESVYEKRGTLLEKYNVEEGSEHVAQGEYPLQRGFGWTNGVASALRNRFSPF